MSLTEKLIFNYLVSGRAVFLPDIGYLYPVRIPAKISGRKIIAPEIIIRYSSHPQEGCLSIVDIICSEGIGITEAESIYNNWRQENLSDGNLSILGVGVLRKKHFTPDSSLTLLLNPFKCEGAMDTKKRVSFATPLLISLLILVGGSTLWIYLYPQAGAILSRKLSGNVYYNATTTENKEDNALITEFREGIGVEPTVGAEEELTPVTPQPETAYHVVAGVFSMPENADKYISQLERKFPDAGLLIEKIPYKSGKIMVSLYNSPDSEEAQRALSRISSEISNYDLWLYGRKPE